jgi:hypothetical protein
MKPAMRGHAHGARGSLRTVLRHIDAALGFVAAAALGACVAIDPNANLCAVGGVDCVCTMGGACDPGLECKQGMCVDPDAPTTGDPSTTDDGTDDDTDPTSDDDTDETSVTDPTSASDPTTDDTGPQPSMPNVVFVTSAQFTAGAIGGLEGADSKCQDAADAAGMPGMYRAWLSVGGEDARDRLGDASGWARQDGRPFARDVPQISAGHFFFPPVIDEHGVFTTGSVWTGTLAGIAEPAGGNFCGDWTSDDGAAFGLVGDLGAGPGWWSGFSTLPCNMPARLVCLGVDQQHELQFEPMDGRLAFVSAGLIPPTAGRAAADAMCQQEASSAGHDGSFLALLGTNGEAPAARFDGSGARWVRHDGVPIFPDGDPFSVQLETPIAFDAMGNDSLLAIVWAGSYDAITPGTNESSCTNWSATTGFSAMFNVIHIYWMGWMLGGGDSECAQGGYSVVCLEE